MQEIGEKTQMKAMSLDWVGRSSVNISVCMNYDLFTKADVHAKCRLDAVRQSKYSSAGVKESQ